MGKTLFLRVHGLLGVFVGRWCSTVKIIDNISKILCIAIMEPVFNLAFKRYTTLI